MHNLHREYLKPRSTHMKTKIQDAWPSWRPHSGRMWSFSSLGVQSALPGGQHATAIAPGREKQIIAGSMKRALQATVVLLSEAHLYTSNGWKRVPRGASHTWVGSPPPAAQRRPSGSARLCIPRPVSPGTALGWTPGDKGDGVAVRSFQRRSRGGGSVPEGRAVLGRMQPFPGGLRAAQGADGEGGWGRGGCTALNLKSL